MKVLDHVVEQNNNCNKPTMTVIVVCYCKCVLIVIGMWELFSPHLSQIPFGSTIIQFHLLFAFQLSLKLDSFDIEIYNVF